VSAFNDANEYSFQIVYGASYLDGSKPTIAPNTPLYVRLKFSRNQEHTIALNGKGSCQKTWRELAEEMEWYLGAGWNFDGVEPCPGFEALEQASVLAGKAAEPVAPSADEDIDF